MKLLTFIFSWFVYFFFVIWAYLILVLELLILTINISTLKHWQWFLTTVIWFFYPCFFICCLACRYYVCYSTIDTRTEMIAFIKLMLLLNILIDIRILSRMMLFQYLIIVWGTRPCCYMVFKITFNTSKAKPLIIKILVFILTPILLHLFILIIDDNLFVRFACHEKLLLWVASTHHGRWSQKKVRAVVWLAILFDDVAEMILLV